MQSLSDQLINLTNSLNYLIIPEIDTLDDAKELKTLLFNVDCTIKKLKLQICTIEQQKLQILQKLNRKIKDIKVVLEKSEKKFMIQYSQPIKKNEIQLVESINVDIGIGVPFKCALYNNKNDIAILQYGVILHNSHPMVVYRYGIKDFVSVSSCQVMDFHSPHENYRTICCGNSESCEYDDNCKYYHDPIVWPNSDHIQRFMRSAMVKKCPYFGHNSLFIEQQKTVTFENVRTLARYCAVMSLMISLIAK